LLITELQLAIQNQERGTEMKGKVCCRFVGGSKDEETHVIAAMACRDVLKLEREVWMAQGRDGNVSVMKGPIPPRAPWIHFVREIYEKVKPVVPGHVTYKFVCTEAVNRCEKILDQKGRRCRNEAETGTSLCREHNKPAPEPALNRGRSKGEQSLPLR
jgi:hypothetical protein